ncbi:RluA family pseudouridine synthase [Yanghanlia caeni]|uniref:Pseudouridine synthase n=1 Tax=Yanghanlia caeni TaxID=3064283 RepID=A0ABU1D656_9BURK|nr:RluA family pseudouridine synthase [Alcaligenaceae bacterium LG-2]
MCKHEPLEYRLGAASASDRLDKILAQLLPEHSRSRLQGWIEQGHVLINGAPARIRQRVGPGDHIVVHPQPAPEDSAFVPEPVDFEVVAESPAWLVVNKPAGLVTHPGAGNWQGTLLNGLLHRYPELARVPRAGIVHRLDKDTSGIMVVARTEIAQTHMVRQLQARSVHREYVALAHGRLSGSGTIDRPLGRHPAVPVRMTVERPIAPKPAITHYAVQRQGSDADGAAVTEVVCRLETGRTHQIRAHLASIGHPLVADTVYGGRPLASATRHMLHARALTFDDPEGTGSVSFQVDPPADFAVVLEHIQWQSTSR